jgi:FixJ family two-component response regulator
MSELIFIVDDDERVYRNPQVFLEDEGNQFILQASQQQSQLQFLIHTGSTDY